MREKKRPAQTPDVGMVLMDLSLKPLAINRGAAAILSKSKHTGVNGDFPVQMPAEILELIRDRKPADLSSLETHFRSGPCEYVCRAFLVEPVDGVFKHPIVALHLERHCDVTDVVQTIAVEHNLTNREQEALRGISMGLSSKELAARMNISPNTARAFSRLIMIKMNVRSRAGVAAKLLQVHGRKKSPAAIGVA